MQVIPDSPPKNVIYILSDDHRYDFMGFTGKVPWLKTPNLDRLAAEGAYFPNAYVTTALCSPSRASILTGLYSHSHMVVDNAAPDPGNLTFFPEYLQQAGYQTSFLASGTWAIILTTQPGFDHWESFRGQGVYYGPTLNINGERIDYDEQTYITDLLTSHAVDWLENRDKENRSFYTCLIKQFTRNSNLRRGTRTFTGTNQLFCPTLSTHHSMANPPFPLPAQPANRCAARLLWPEQLPDWVKAQRESWHGVDYMYHGDISFDEFFHRYTETLMGVDDSVGSVLDYLDASDLAKDTLVIYMGDNGFSFGEHGLIDKRHFYEESAKVPLLVRWPEMLEGGQPINQLVQNIDIAPTILEAAGLNAPAHMQGASLLPLLSRGGTDWRDRIFYEYYWEMDFPQTPTMFGVRTERYKYIRYHGIWDTNELYDLLNDPGETNKFIDAPEHQYLITGLATEVYQWLEETGGMQIPLKNVVRPKFGDHRNQSVL